MKNNPIIIFILLLIWGCANRIQPTGGPKDIKPPELISSIPENGQRNFKDQELAIEFDELITVKDIKEQLIITPRINGEYDFRTKKKTFFLNFDEPLTDSTTYTLNFRDGLVDLTESNPAVELQLAFSTGNLLDTLEISGVVLDILTQDPIDGATIGLYDVDDTLDIFSGQPYYFTKSNEAGKYTFKNIKDGAYRLYSFFDNNKNLTCQSEKEKYAFLANTIMLDTIHYADTMNIQYLNIDTLVLKRARPNGRYFTVTANKYLTNATLRSTNDSTLAYKYDDDHKSLKVYNTFSIIDSLKVFATLQDSLGMVVQDSFYLKFPTSTRKLDEFKASFKKPNASLKKKIISGEIVFDKPLQQIVLDSVSIKRDSLEQYYLAEKISYQLDSINHILKYTIEIPQAILDSLSENSQSPATPAAKGTRKKLSKANYELSFPKASFISVEDDSLKATVNQIKLTDSSQSGLISGSINTSYKSFIIQLLDNKYEVVKEHKNGTSYVFSDVVPGEYYIRVLIDNNENGKWDLAYFRQNIPAEGVIIYKDGEGNSKTVLRANWELTVDLAF